MTTTEARHLLRVLRGAGLKLTRQRLGYYVARCPSCGGRLEVYPDAPSPDLAIICRGRVEIIPAPQESVHVH